MHKSPTTHLNIKTIFKYINNAINHIKMYHKIANRTQHFQTSHYKTLHYPLILAQQPSYYICSHHPAPSPFHSPYHPLHHPLPFHTAPTLPSPKQEQQTALHIASRLGNIEVASMLLQAGAQVDASTKDNYTPFHIACKEGHLEMVDLLLDHGADMTATTKVGG